MKKKYIVLAIFMCLFFSLPSLVYADYSAEINNTSVRIRSNPGTNNSILYTVSTGTPINVVDKTLYSGTGCDEKWYKVTYKGNTGYVCSRYVTFVNNTFNGIDTTGYTARVNANNVNVRYSDTKNSTLLDTLSLGVNVKILDTTNRSNSGCSSNRWYHIEYYNKKTGYICSNYVTKIEEITATDPEYAQVLREAGFPDSYIPYLTYLHNKYPNWVFTPKNTNTNFSTAVDAEEGKNYMQTTNDNYRTSSTPAEASSWFRVNKSVIAFYMDPRNWLTEERIFMFEKLDYDQSFDTQYPVLVKTVFGDGALSADQYTVPMYNSGKKYGISPLHIASRIRLEVGKNGSDSTNGTTFTYNGNTYSGYYNFFNIGAYEQTVNGVHYSSITMGLVTAMNKGWDTIDKAIDGGAAFLANGYITQGQGTLYYQKFNVRPGATYSSYTHQYMTNIQAPATEGNQTYNSYADSNILSQSFIFEIPVYNNMPEYTSLPDRGSSNNYLSRLEVRGFELSPEFDKEVLTYEVNVPANTNSVHITVVTEDRPATITPADGDFELPSTRTDISFVVTAVSGDKRTYTITFIKDEDNTNTGGDNTGNGDSGNNGNNDNTGSGNTSPDVPTTGGGDNQTTIEEVIQESNITVNNNVVTNIKYDTKASTIKNRLTENGAMDVVIKNTNGNALGNNDIIGTGCTLTIMVEGNQVTYTFSIIGDTSGDGKVTILDLLQVQKHLQGDKKLTNAYFKAADTSGDNNVTILDLLQIQKHLQGDKVL